eukprot:832319-Rhodomonas_salina.6
MRASAQTLVQDTTGAVLSTWQRRLCAYRHLHTSSNIANVPNQTCIMIARSPIFRHGPSYSTHVRAHEKLHSYPSTNMCGT